MNTVIELATQTARSLKKTSDRIASVASLALLVSVLLDAWAEEAYRHRTETRKGL